MMKSVVLMFLVLLVSASVAVAVQPNKQLEFTHSSMGTVIFDGKLHNEHAKGCRECHNKDVFPKMKQGTVTITMDEIYAGKLCGICHNGNRAFTAKGNCGRCHKK